MNLITMLPLLKGWNWSYRDKNNITIPAGKEWEAGHKVKQGWIRNAGVSLSSPDAELVITYDKSLKLSSDPSSVYASGVTVPNNSGVYCPVYTAGPPPIYNLFYAPYMPTPFNREIRLVIKNPTVLPIVVYGYVHLLIIIEDIELFEKSIRRLIS